MNPTRDGTRQLANAAPDAAPTAPIGGSRLADDVATQRPFDMNSATARFLTWWGQRGGEDSPWPAFDQFIREMLLDWVGAKRVRLYQVVDGGRALQLLTDEVGSPTTLSAPTDLMDHVVSVGRPYVRGDWSHGPLVDQLAAESAEEAGSNRATTPPVDHDGRGLPTVTGPVAWVFPIRDHEAGTHGDANAPLHRSIGLVVVGELDEASLADHDMLHGITALVTEFWLHVRDYECLQIVRRTDRGSGVLNRLDFLRVAETAVAEARREGEPVALLAVALEGLRRFDDDGLWFLRDRVIQETGRILRRKLRTGDLVGRFSDDRFVILMRWLDLSLGRLIATRVVSWVQEAAAEAVHRVQEDTASGYEAKTPTLASDAGGAVSGVKVRCGLACDYRVNTTQPDEHLAWGDAPESLPKSQPSLRALLMGALSASAQARRKGDDLCVADVRASGVSAAVSTVETMVKIDRLKMGSVGVVAPHGAITQTEIDELSGAIETTRQPAAGRVVLDMSDVAFVDSKALEALFDFADRQRSAGQTAKLAGLSETCREILDLTDLLGEFEVFDSVDSAVRSFL